MMGKDEWETTLDGLSARTYGRWTGMGESGMNGDSVREMRS